MNLNLRIPPEVILEHESDPVKRLKIRVAEYIFSIIWPVIVMDR